MREDVHCLCSAIWCTCGSDVTPKNSRRCMYERCVYLYICIYIYIYTRRIGRRIGPAREAVFWDRRIGRRIGAAARTFRPEVLTAPHIYLTGLRPHAADPFVCHMNMTAQESEPYHGMSHAQLPRNWQKPFRIASPDLKIASKSLKIRSKSLKKAPVGAREGLCEGPSLISSAYMGTVEQIL